MSDGIPTPDEDRSLVVLHRIAVAGAAAAGLLAALVGILGGTGRGSLAVLLLVLALTAATIGLVGVVFGLRDEARGATFSRARLVWTIAGFGGSTLLLAMLVGVLA